MKNALFYSYCLCDPRIEKPSEYLGVKLHYEPFYVGKGKGYRIYNHLYNCHLKTKSKKNDRIKEIRDQGLEPVLVFLKEGLTNVESFYIEKLFIDRYRFVGNGGTLLNKNNGMSIQKIGTRSVVLKSALDKYQLIPFYIFQIPSVTHLLLEEKSLTIKSVHSSIEEVASVLNITRRLALQVSTNKRPYNIVKKNVIIQRSDIPYYFKEDNSPIAF